MSTVTYRNRTIACDLKMTTGNHTNESAFIKIHKANGHLFGGVGNPFHLTQIFDWVDDGMRQNDLPQLMIMDENDPIECDIMMVKPDGSIWQSNNCHFPHFIPVQSGFMALGSGCAYAVGAMAHGAGAREAAMISGRYDIYSGWGVASASLDDAEPVAVEIVSQGPLELGIAESITHGEVEEAA